MRSKSSVRIAIADSHPIFRLGVKTLLARHAGFDVVGEAGDTKAAVDVVAKLLPDVLLLDHNPPRLNGLEVVRLLKTARSVTKPIIVTAEMPEADIQAALLDGVWGVLLKNTANEVLPDCIRQVMLGEHWIGLESVNPLVSGLRASGRGGSWSLTPREVDIVKRIAKGAGNKDIARQLQMGEQTVKNHLRRIFRKLRVNNRVELALLAVEQDLVLPTEVDKSLKSAAE